MFVLGTAGHVDHGKSTLLRRLTQMDPDRLPEERVRGMTIELNFLHFRSPRFGCIGIVDVPGHQRLVKTFVAGTSSFDAFIFCVAADDGWMPQSEEHLSVLNGLGIHRGILVVTKADVVDEARALEVKTDATDRISEKVKWRCPAVTLGLKTPLDEFIAGLDALMAELPPPANRDAARVWVDRAFSPKGMGVVVTGTLREGAISQNDELWVLPTGEACSVRSLQSYGVSVGRAAPNVRLALGLSGIGFANVKRGDLLVSRFPPPLTSVFDASLTWLKPFRRGRVQLCFGTWHGTANVIPLSDQFARIRLKSLPVRFGDRFILRRPGGEETLGVGTVLDPNPVRKHKVALDLLAGEPLSHESFVMRTHQKDGCISISRLLGSSDLSQKVDLSQFKCIGDWAVTLSRWESLKSSALEAVEKNPGLNFKEIEGYLSIPFDAARSIVEDLGTKIQRLGAGFTVHGRKSPNPFREALGGGLPVKVTDLTRGDAGIKKAFDRVVAEGEVVVLGDFAIEAGAFKVLTDKVKARLLEVGSATTSDLKTILGLSRNHAVLVLERMDRDRVTYLKDGVRRLLRLPSVK